MATYNSSKYLKPQIDSLLNQTYKEFTLYIRDDGSQDETIAIINKYQQQQQNIILLNDPIKNREAMGSFIWLLESIEADYYMFCDHDDIWLENKIELSMAKMQKIESPNTPSLIFTDLRVVTEDLNIIAPSMWRYEKLRPKLLTQKRFATTKNIFTGCTMLINNQAKQISLPISPKAIMHDSWIGLRVIAHNGNIGYIQEPQLLYRQHGNNAVGSAPIENNLNYYLSKLKNIPQILKKWDKIYIMASSAFEIRIPFFQYYLWKFTYLIIRWF
ncbi:MAG: glycosyltransferase family 2 protein [Rikenellaceae bacterium]